MAVAGDPRLAQIDPEFEEYLKKAPPPPVLTGDIHALRARLLEAKRALTQSVPNTTAALSEEDRQIPTRDGTEITVRVYTPDKEVQGGHPLFVMFHGGGFCLGALDSEELNCRLFCEKLGFVVVNVDYRLAPEHPFPTPINDAWDAVKWAAANTSALKADPKKGFVIGGISAGANFSAVISHLARDEHLSPALTGVYLSIPTVVDANSMPEKYKSEFLSHEQNKNPPILGRDSIDMFMASYKPDRTSPLYSPFLHPNGHKNLPPTYFQICGMDPLRDEGLIYERVLREECGVKTRLDMYPGLPHGFWSFFPDLKSSRKLLEDTLKGVEWLLEEGQR
ncbi:MAG: hypothetical protein M1830_004066 [Pleopsidium flavum]|nr:MAG: hypothetical protein M1830_004066 [Pleopsidium flavum]